MSTALMILGTASNVGKSVVAAGLCRIFHNHGLNVAPFKAQNMSLNSCVTPEGGEMSWAQTAQAEACGIAPHVDMNPVLLKPTAGKGSQVIVQGKVFKNVQRRLSCHSEAQIWKRIRESYLRLEQRFPLIVLEGMGGAAEVNLKDHDLANFRMADFADANVLLVGDIEHGGIFASVIGTINLLKPRERKRIKGIIINKFRGDSKAFKNGIKLIERETKIPVLGIIPYYERMNIPDEDAAAVDRKKRDQPPFTPGTINIAVIRLPHIANITDFADLEREKDVTLRYLTRPEQLSTADVVILPGSKSTLTDLQWIRNTRWAEKILSFVQNGGRIIGICGGYQMLGKEVIDQYKVDGNIQKARGLGLLPAWTQMASTKITDKVVAWPMLNGLHKLVQAYEIHMGQTKTEKGVTPAFRIVRRGQQVTTEYDGAVSAGGKVWGTYLHGLFANRPFTRGWLNELYYGKGIEGPRKRIRTRDPYEEWAAFLMNHLDVQKILRLVDFERCHYNHASK